MGREIKFRALIGDSETGQSPYWEYYTTLFCPSWLDSKTLITIVKDLQFTGLKDKNDVEIYEGDIINFGGDGICIVESGVNSQGLDTFNFIHPKHGKYGGIESPEIIGNIYENPELLEAK